MCCPMPWQPSIAVDTARMHSTRGLVPVFTVLASCRYDDEADRELLTLLPFLESLVDVPDVRPAIEAAYNLRQLVDKAPPH